MRRLHAFSRERRGNLGELEPSLRERLLALDEPVARDDWADVVARSRAFRSPAVRRRGFAAAAVGAAAAACALAVAGSGLMSGHRVIEAGGPANGHARATALRADLSDFVLYSRVQDEQFVKNTDGRARGLPRHSFEAFNTRLPVMSDTGGGPLAGDEEVFRFALYSNQELDSKNGSETVTCFFEQARKAFCGASIQMRNGDDIAASGMLIRKSMKFNFAVTGGTGRYGGDEGALEEIPISHHALRLSFEFV